MKEDGTIKSKLQHYMDAGFPILYVNTYEEDKVDAIIAEIKYDKEVYEWNESNGYIDFDTKTPVQEDCGLEQMLDQLKTKELLDNKIIVLKDIVPYFDEPRIVSKIKGLARLISQAADATIIIVSSTLVIPKDLEKYITILEMDYLGTKEIKQVIHNFITDWMDDQEIDEKLIGEYAVAFKGLTEFEIMNLLALAYSNDGELNRSDLSLIFEKSSRAFS